MEPRWGASARRGFEKKGESNLMIPEKSFPHACLQPSEATPRIAPSLAGEVLIAVETARNLGLCPTIQTAPAICIAVWSGAMVKWLVDEVEAQQTLDNLRGAIERAKTTARLMCRG